MSTLPLGHLPSQTTPEELITVPHPHAASTTNNNGPKSVSRFRLRAKPAKSQEDVALEDSTSSSATASLIRRVLIQESPRGNKKPTRHSPPSAQDPLPPLTSSNEVDLQLYAIIAVILKDFVDTWYTKITPDRNFKGEVIQIIAHISRAVEERLRHIDLVDLMLNDVAALIGQHVRVYRLATAQSGQYSYAHREREIYHSLNPHPALSPVPVDKNSPQIAEQKDNESVYRQLLVTGALAVLLPIEDAQNTALRVLLCDVLADLILEQAIAGKVCEGWFLHDSVTKVIDLINGEVGLSLTEPQQKQEIKSRLETFGLLNYREKQKAIGRSSKQRSGLAGWFWTILQGLYVTFLWLRFVIQGLNKARSPSSRLRVGPNPHSSSNKVQRLAMSSNSRAFKQPFLTLEIFNTFSILLRVQDRMPWLQSLFAFLQHIAVYGIGQLASADAVLDRFLHNTAKSVLLPPTLLPQLLRSCRAVIFPNNTLGPPAPPPPSTNEEKAAIRKKAAISILSSVPATVVHIFFGTADDEEIAEQIAMDILDCFGDEYMNKHLIYGILETILVRLIPELGEKSTHELLFERDIDLFSVPLSSPSPPPPPPPLPPPSMEVKPSSVPLNLN